MKTMSLNRNTLGLALIASLASPLALAEGPGGKGGSTSHGGDTLVMEFTGTQANLAEWYVKNGSLSACPAPSMILDAVKGPNRFEVTSEPVVFVNGREEDAATDVYAKPVHTILSRTRLVNKAKDQGYALLALHEIFVGLKLETTNDTSKSKACLDQMIAAELKVNTTVVSFTPYQSIITAFHENRALLNCSSDRHQNIQVSLDAYLRLRAENGVVEHFPTNWKYGTDVPYMSPISLKSFYNLATGSAEIRSFQTKVLGSNTRFKEKRNYHGPYYRFKEGFDTESFIEVQSNDGVRFELILTGKLSKLSEAFGNETQARFDCEMLYPSAK